MLSLLKNGGEWQMAAGLLAHILAWQLREHDAHTIANITGYTAIALMVLGCSLHLRKKGYPVFLGVIGLASLFGIGIAVLVPDRSEAYSG